jgi:hypothetical protein
LVGASSVVCPCIAEWGWSRQRVIGLVRRRRAAHDDRRDQRVSLCRVGLAPTASLMRRDWLGQAATGSAVTVLVPWAAVIGSQAWPVVITACRCRRIAAAITVCAWVGVSLFCWRVVRCAYLAA